MKDDRTLDEYSWENDLRERDKKNRQYISELPKYIYLPEENIIINEGACTINSYRFDSGDFEYMENLEEEYIDKEHPMMKKIIGLARSWLLIQSAALENSEKKLGLQVSALLAMAVERLFIIIQVAGDCPGWTIAYCKRLHSELSKCEELMRKIAKNSIHLEAIIAEKTTILAEVSEFASDTIFKLRKNKTTQS